MAIASISFACLMLIATALPLVRSDYWTFRAMEYPRLQKWVLTLAAAGLWRHFGWAGNWADYLIGGGLALSMGYLSWQIFPYLPIASRQLKSVKQHNAASPDDQLKLLVANVLQYNTENSRLLRYIEQLGPDIILLLETDKPWQERMAALEQSHPFTLHAPQDNTYGLLFYSRLPIHGGQIRYLVEPDIPSIKAQITLGNGERVQVFGLHPRPPAPSESRYATAKDQELLLVATEAAEAALPCLVAGDLNDVAWSYTTGLFQRISGLLDPRKGRGFYNTFSAKSILMRFPLDHVFCSSHFRVVRMRRLGHIGSDHFPIFIQLHLDKRYTNGHDTPTPDESDKAEAAEKLSKL
ncbi:endonuclease/exonuclease/phosphatase family protein [Phaeodactylibacter luteus]|uniref:Endonuclease/exonuclease/phosphatase family protein n=1 Tax=Phaeodactylibacter luteus TaxID=1564516 RepID=A0A5C6RIE5_9BACT|nr:endonuclease/exonuclease/phosphatase family protein [Phaeodactylibacter luteus]TXB61440.1 endonuclease/exonuclease/phosphatase family protein [Phaeodactylibacter luteus]